jgi:hypothetical protein
MDEGVRRVHPVQADRTRARLTHGETDLVEQHLIDTAAPRDRGGDETRRTDVGGGRGNLQADGRHAQLVSLRRRRPRPPCRGWGTPSPGR